MPPDQSPFFSVRNLRSAYGGPYDFTLARGECVCILGASGSGKSVLLRLVADLDPGTGIVSLNDIDRDDWPAPEWRQHVLYQAAEPAWWGHLVTDHFRPSDLPLATTLLQKLELSPAVLTQVVDRLSTGERQRLALVRSLVRRPEVLLLDEPTASLDRVTTAAVEALLVDQMKTGLAILLVTHSNEQAERMSHRQFQLRDHQLHLWGTA